MISKFHGYLLAAKYKRTFKGGFGYKLKMIMIDVHDDVLNLYNAVINYCLRCQDSQLEQRYE